jgi:hypothetical protein
MADGNIVYEVRVDSSNVDADLSQAGSLLEKGTQEINRLAASTAQTFGKMLGDVFGGSASYAEKAVSNLGTSFEKLRTSTGPLMSALIPISKELEKISKLSLASVGAAVGKVTANAAPAASSSPAISAAARKSAFVLPSFKVGTSYIPYDDFPALLHKGEAVLTASENAALKAAGGINALNNSQPVIMQNHADSSSDFGNRPVEVTLKIGEYEFTQIIADTMNNLYRQWGANPLK